MTSLEYYSKRKEDSRQELATLIAQANQFIGDTHNSLNTHTNQGSNITNKQTDILKMKIKSK